MSLYLNFVKYHNILAAKMSKQRVIENKATNQIEKEVELSQLVDLKIKEQRL